MFVKYEQVSNTICFQTCLRPDLEVCAIHFKLELIQPIKYNFALSPIQTQRGNLKCNVKISWNWLKKRKRRRVIEQDS